MLIFFFINSVSLVRGLSDGSGGDHLGGVDKVVPGCRKASQEFASLVGQLIILAGRPGFGLHPFILQQPGVLEPRKKGIQRALHDDDSC